MSTNEVEALERKHVVLWECPDCCFAFDARHVNAGDDGYSCPVCAEVELERRLKATKEALLIGIRKANAEGDLPALALMENALAQLDAEQEVLAV